MLRNVRAAQARNVRAAVRLAVVLAVCVNADFYSERVGREETERLDEGCWPLVARHPKYVLRLLTVLIIQAVQ